MSDSTSATTEPNLGEKTGEEVAAEKSTEEAPTTTATAAAANDEDDTTLLDQEEAINSLKQNKVRVASLDNVKMPFAPVEDPELSDILLTEPLEVKRVEDGLVATILNFFSGDWVVHTFKLKNNQELLQCDEDDNILKSFSTVNSVTKKLSPSEADGKEFAFEFTNDKKESLILNAVREEVREKCILLFNLSGRDQDAVSPLTSPSGGGGSGGTFNSHKQQQQQQAAKDHTRRRGSSYVDHNLADEDEIEHGPLVII